MDISKYEISCYDLKRRKNQKYYEWSLGLGLLGLLVVSALFGILD
jgi:hypothetical protein